jgi:CRISPR/Cas system endoribonuclease Cas6 (RAMP superfamily)
MKGMDMKRSFEQELELSLYKLFREKLSEEFDIQVEQRLYSKKRPDIAISKGDKRLAIIEVKPRFYRGESRVDVENQVTELAYSEGFRYAIIAVD